MQNNDVLYQKYNVPTPRYTSYPTVPHWEEPTICKQKWRMKVREAFKANNDQYGISLYIHLPYCESLCTYCGCNTRITVNHAVERPYIDGVLKEFDMYLAEFGEAPNLKELHLGGGTPTFFSHENLAYLIGEIDKRCVVNPDAEFSFEAHPANTTEDHLKTLNKFGFSRLSLGIQDFDPEIQRIINRKQSLKDVENVCDHARSLGYKSINFDIIYGLPKQTLESVEDTISKILMLKPDRIAYYSYAHVPWKHKGQRAYDESDLPSDAYKRNLYELGKELLLKAGYEEVGMDHFALPTDDLAIAFKEKSLHRNFMGYIPMPSKFLLGLGVSSISDVDLAYGQNTKVVEDYLARLNKGGLPVVKGHFMTEMDRVTKTVVNEIMCNHRLEASKISGIPFEVKVVIYDQLHKLEADGLLKLGEWIEVTPLGKQFVRNIAAAFDYRLQNSAQGKFSMSI